MARYTYEEKEILDRLQKERHDSQKEIIRLIIIGLSLLFIVILLYNSFYIIQAGQRGVLLTFGNADLNAKTEGFHFKIPLVQKIIKMDIQTQKYEAELTAASRHLQDVKTKIAINYHIIPENVPVMYRDIGLSYADKVIYPLEQEVNKAITAQFTAEELITKREDVRDKMKTLLSERLQPRGIVIEEISIIDFAFSNSFTLAIENKVTQEQNALAAKNKLEQVKYEAEQRIAEAEGEARAITIQAQAIQSQGGKDYVELKRIEKWDGKLSIVVGGTPIVDLRDSMAMSYAATTP